MSKLDDILDKVISQIVLPIPVFKLDLKDHQPDSTRLTFELKHKIKQIDINLSQGSLELLAYESAVSNVSLKRYNYQYFINREAIVKDFEEKAMAQLIRHWLHVNDKAEWRRCKLKQKFSRNKVPKEEVIDLWMDGTTYGVFASKLDPTKAALNKFFAKKFEQLGEKYG